MLSTAIVSVHLFFDCQALTRRIVKSEGGVDCARVQGDDQSNGLNDKGMTKSEDVHGWPAMNARANGALTM